MSDEWKQHARITGFQKRIAELERENVELRAEFGLALEAVNAQLLAQEAENECLIAQNLELELDAKNAQITRLQAVARAAQRPANLPALLLTINALERDDLKEVK